jgi:hypothetical protein
MGGAAAEFAVALGIGLLIGLERERHKGSGPGREAAGIRTFALVSLLGAAGNGWQPGAPGAQPWSAERADWPAYAAAPDPVAASRRASAGRAQRGSKPRLRRAARSMLPAL